MSLYFYFVFLLLCIYYMFLLRIFTCYYVCLFLFIYFLYLHKPFTVPPHACPLALKQPAPCLPNPFLWLTSPLSFPMHGKLLACPCFLHLHAYMDSLFFSFNKNTVETESWRRLSHLEPSPCQTVSFLPLNERW